MQMINQDWINASKSYCEYLNKKNRITNEVIYIDYIHCMKMYIFEGKQVTKEIIGTYENECTKIVKRLSRHKTEMKKIIEIDTLASEYFFSIGQIYAYFQARNKARINYINGIEIYHGRSLENIISIIQKNLDLPGEVKSTFEFISGRNNYGVLIHQYKDKQYITKISTNSTLTKRENFFYKEISPKYKQLQGLTPYYVCNIRIDDLSYLTMEMIDSVDSNVNNIEQIIKTSQKISSLPYEEINKLAPNLNYKFILKNKPNTVIFLFTKIHKKKYNKKLLNDLSDLLNKHNYSKEVKSVVPRLGELIVDNGLYNYISLKKHYSLIHGDFNARNVRVIKKSGEIKVIDWETFKIGFKHIDVARYFSGLRIPFVQIQQSYLENDELNGDLDLIEKIFFVYALIILYILTIRENDINNYLDTHIRAALNYLEQNINEFKKENYTEQFAELKKIKTKQRLLNKKYVNMKKNINIEREKNKYLEHKLLEMEEKYQTLFIESSNKEKGISHKVRQFVKGITLRK